MVTIRSVSAVPGVSAGGVLAGFVGEVLVPGEEGFESVRAAAVVPGHPTWILRPRDGEDVCRAVRFAVESGLEIAVRGGGHSFAGLSSTDGGVLVDLTHLDAVEVLDVDRGLVRVGGGATWGQVIDVLQPLGLAISSGDTRSVGVGGLTLGGGIGWKVRSRGLALDSLVAVELVTADGQLVRADATSRPELFWAVRGGGGNFGIVIAFEFRAHPTTRVFFGRITIQTNDRARVLAGWADRLRQAPLELTSIVNLANPAAGGPLAPVEILVAFDSDNPTHAATAIDPIRRLGDSLGTIIDDDVTVMDYDKVFQPGGLPPAGIRFFTRAGFVDHHAVGQALNILADAAGQDHTPAIAIRALGGAITHIPDDATAYPYRSAELLVATIAAGPDSANNPSLTATQNQITTIWDQLVPHLAGTYANFLDTATPQDTTTTYPPHTRERLIRIKNQTDPTNVFHRNHNVT